MVNGWFPKINSLNQVVSGNDGIWLDGVQVSLKGTNPFWIGTKLCYNLNDGRTQVGDNIVDKAYNEYYGSEQNEWTGFLSSNGGHVDFYNGSIKTNEASGLTLAKYAGYGSVYGFNLAYVAPYNDGNRILVYNNVPIYQGWVTNYAVSLNGIIAWQIATGVYSRQILIGAGIISIRSDENPISVFEYLGQSWILTQTEVGLLCYPLGGVFGYYISGNLYYPDSRVIGNRLRIVGSSSSGEPLFDNYIDFTEPRIDLNNI